jgi:D-cysteine desulfhydrase
MSSNCSFCLKQLFQKQVVAQDVSFDYCVVPSGSGGTHAGMALGLYESGTKCIGISTRHPKDHQTRHIHKLAETTLHYIMDNDNDDNDNNDNDNNDATVPDDAVVVFDEYVGPGYSLPTEEMEEAVTLFARLEGILLDPVYTGKAAAGLIGLVRQGYFPEGSNVLFLHTGGAPSLYHYQPMAPDVKGIAGAGKQEVVEVAVEEEEMEEKKES